MLKEKLIQYKKKKQNNWKSPKGAKKRRKSRSRVKKEKIESYKPTPNVNFYDMLDKDNKYGDNKSSEFLPRSSKFDYYMNKDNDYDNNNFNEDNFELTGLEAQIIRSAFEETNKDEKQKMREYLEDGKQDNTMEGDVICEVQGNHMSSNNHIPIHPNVDEEITTDYIRQLKNKFEHWNEQSDNILNKEISQSQTFKLTSNNYDNNDDPMYYTNQHKNRLGVVRDNTIGSIRKDYLKKNNYERKLYD